MIRVLDDAGALAEAAAAVFAGEVREAFRSRGRCAVALAGGSTPRSTYRILGETYRSSVPWERLDLFWGDERLVPPDHPDSNEGMVRDELIERLSIPEANIHPVRTLLGSAREAADDYQAELRAFFNLAGAELPRFDLVLLGLGEDGHTASLMPGSEAVGERGRLVSVCALEHLEHPRVTLTLPVLNAARRVVFLVSGQRKAEILWRVLEGPPQPDELPAQAVRPDDGAAWWLVDRDAASRLTDGETAGESE